MANKKKSDDATWRTMVVLPAVLRRPAHAAAQEAKLTPVEWLNQTCTKMLREALGVHDEPPETTSDTEGPEPGLMGVSEYVESGVGGAGANPQYFPELSNEALMMELEEACMQMQEDFRYPMNRNGDQMDFRFLGPWIAYHLVRCGWRQIPERRMIKARPPEEIPAGCYEDLVEWVSLDTPDRIDFSNLTIEQMQQLPPSVQASAIRQLGGHTDTVLSTGEDPRKIWKQPVHLEVDDPDFEQQLKEQ